MERAAVLHQEGELEEAVQLHCAVPKEPPQVAALTAETTGTPSLPRLAQVQEGHQDGAAARRGLRNAEQGPC